MPSKSLRWKVRPREDGLRASLLALLLGLRDAVDLFVVEVASTVRYALLGTAEEVAEDLGVLVRRADLVGSRELIPTLAECRVEIYARSKGSRLERAFGGGVEDLGDEVVVGRGMRPEGRVSAARFGAEEGIKLTVRLRCSSSVAPARR